MSFFSLFAVVVFAAETIVSPIPDGTPVVVPPLPKPAVSFGQIVNSSPSSQVLGESIDATPSATPTPPPHTTNKKSYTIAFLGDSMIDTMGPGLPAVQSRLHGLYPATNFNLLNYGVGATNLEYGIDRITNSYNYLGNQIPSLASTHPDVVVLESFAYNPFPDADGGVNRHWLDLGRAVDTLRQTIPGVKIVIAATIAPHPSEVMSADHVAVIASYLESTIAFANGEHLPLADAYHGSVPEFTNPGDHIHYSDAGRAFFAQKVTEAIQSSRLLE